MGMPLHLRIIRKVPQQWINTTFLHFPALYRTGLVNYESNIDAKMLEHIASTLVELKDTEGDIIECGAARCGTSAIMSHILKQHGISKLIYACDTFEGFDKAEITRENAEGMTAMDPESFDRNSFEYVRNKMTRLGCDNVHLVRGLFQDTLTDLVKDKSFCFALIDCDLEQSATYAAKQIWPHLAHGGAMFFDDYGTTFKGIDIAVASSSRKKRRR